MVIRTKKDVPLYEKFGLFTEAPRKKKRVINVRASRAKDYTVDVDPEETTLNNISSEEDPFSGDDGLDFNDPEDLGGNISDEIPTETEPQPVTDTQPDDGTGAPSEGTDGTSGTSTNNTPDSSTGGNATGGGNDDAAVPGTQGADGGITPDNVSGEPQDNEVSPTDPGISGGDNTGGDASGDQATPAAAEPTSGTGDNGDTGTTNPGAENQVDPNGTGDVTATDGNMSDGSATDVSQQDQPQQQTAADTPEEAQPDASNEVIEIDDPSGGEDDFTAGLDTDGDGMPDDQASVSPDTNADPNAATPQTTDPNASVDADLAAFDKNDMRKYQLFKRFIDLHDVTIHFVSTLEAIISDDAEYGDIISKVTKKLKRVEGILKDYMVLKFQSDSYLQNSFFFEKSKASVLLALEMLKQGKKPKVSSKQ